MGVPLAAAAGAAVGGVASYFGSQQTSAASIRAVQLQNYYQNQMQWQERDWQRQMSNTAYQRSVADMRAAGLNPAVMFNQGHGESASTPSAGATNIAGASQAIAASGAERNRTLKEVAEIASRVGLNTEQAGLIPVQKKLTEANANTAKTQADLNVATMQQVKKLTERTQTEIDGNKAELARTQNSAKVARALGPVGGSLDYFTDLLGRVFGASHTTVNK